MTIGPYGGSYGPAGNDRAQLRVSSQDRERAIEVLQRAFGDGRLSKEEFDARSGRALEAATFSDLDLLVRDLPAAAPGYAGAPGQQAAWNYPAAAPRTNAMAITSLACGIAQFFGFWLLGTIPAIVCGHVARRQIRQTGEQGAGMATAGLVLGWVGAALSVIVVLAVVVGIVAAAHAGGG